MVIEDPFGIAGGTRSVVERDRVPLVLRPEPLELRAPLLEKSFVVRLSEKIAPAAKRIIDVDHDGLFLDGSERFRDRRAQLTIREQNFGFAVLEDERDRVGIEARVDRLQDPLPPSARRNALRGWPAYWER